MKKLILALLIALACTASSMAGPGGCTNAPWLFPYAFETITVSTTAVGFTTTVYQPAGSLPPDMAIATLETNDIRYRSDGVNPTSSVGHLLTSGSSLTACGQNSIQRVRYIRSSADGTLQVTYYRQSQ